MTPDDFQQGQKVELSAVVRVKGYMFIILIRLELCCKVYLFFVLKMFLKIAVGKSNDSCICLPRLSANKVKQLLVYFPSYLCFCQFGGLHLCSNTQMVSNNNNNNSDFQLFHQHRNQKKLVYERLKRTKNSRYT